MLERKKTFEKGFTSNWTEDILAMVDAVKSTQPITYKLIALKGESIQGSFYADKLQKSKQAIYRIEKVIKKRKRNQILEAYVKWKGYNNAFNSWIPQADLMKN